MTVRPVHPLQRFFAAPALVSPLAHLSDENGGVVVAALCVRVELARAIEQLRNRRDAVGAIKGHFERAHRVPRKLVAERQVHDALVVALGVEPLNLVQDVEASHLSRRLAPSYIRAIFRAMQTYGSSAPLGWR